MKKLFLLLCCWLLVSNQYIFAQQDIILSGKITDFESQEPVPFANLSVKGTATGTTTNFDGEFELHLPQKFLNDSLVVSCIGYFNYYTTINNIKNRQAFHISLKSRSYLMEAFVVKPEEPKKPALPPPPDYTAEEILAKVIENIPNNYMVNPVLMKGFYREYFKENGKYVAFAEAAMNIYDEQGYVKKKARDTQKESIDIEQLRVSDICNDGDYVLYIDIHHVLRGNILRNYAYWKRYLKKARAEVLALQKDSISYYGDDQIYCLSYKLDSKRRGLYKGNVYVRAKDFAVVQLEINAENLLKGREINGAPYQSRSTMTFKEFEGKMYLNYVNASHKVKYALLAKQYDLIFHSELLIHDVKTKGFNPILNKSREVSIFYQPRYRTYDPKYWADYRLFAQSKANADIIADLEKERPLSTQFQVNGKLKVPNLRITAPPKINHEARPGPYNRWGVR